MDAPEPDAQHDAGPPPGASPEETELLRRLDFLEFGPDDQALLRALHPALEGRKEEFASAFYAHLMRYPPLQRVLQQVDLAQLKQVQGEYFSSLTRGEYDVDYLRARQHVGVTHQRIGLSPVWYLGAYRKYLSGLLSVLVQLSGETPTTLVRTFDALLKIIFFDIGLALDAYFEADKRKLQEAREAAEQVSAIFSATSLAVGRPFLSSLVTELAASLGVSYAMVAQLDVEKATAETIALIHDDVLMDNVCYPLAGTPCEAVWRKGLCVYPSRVQDLFPQDALLIEMGLHCYAGIPLHDLSGQPIGILAVFGERELENPERAGRMLEVFSLRAETEIERMHAQARLKASEARFRSAFDQAALGIVHMDCDGAISRANERACAILGRREAQLVGATDPVLAAEPPFSMVGELCRDPFRVLRLLRQVLRPDDSRVWVDFTLSTVREDDGSVAYVQAIMEDVTARKELERALYLYGQALESSSCGVLVMDAEKRGCPVIFANPAFYAMTGNGPDEVLGKEGASLLGGYGEQPDAEVLRQALQHGDKAHVVLRSQHKDGSLFWTDILLSPIRDDAGRTTHYISIQSDVTQDRHYQEQLAFHATHDALTGLPNRSLFHDRLRQAILQAQREGSCCAVLLMDLDAFRLLNDSYGHAVGDELLLKVAARLAAQVRADDTVARYGGDEFAILLKERGDVEQVGQACRALQQVVSMPHALAGYEMEPSMSMGVALFPLDAMEAGALCRYADMALSRAKELGSGSLQFFSEDLNSRVSERAALEVALRSAIPSGALQVRYQPIVDAELGCVVGVEALSRWSHPELGEVKPERFIPIAEDCGLIAQLGRFVLRQACRDLRQWRACSEADVYVAVNVSVRQFRDPGLVRDVSDALAEFSIPPARLVLEVTESVLVHEEKGALQTIERLKALGVSLAMDDFGTGYSSLSYLKHLPFDVVKIDKGFVSDVARSDSDTVLTRTIVAMAQSLGIAALAEGVETREQLECLRGQGYRLFQGFLFSCARPAEEIEALLRAGGRLAPGSGPGDEPA